MRRRILLAVILASLSILIAGCGARELSPDSGEGPVDLPDTPDTSTTKDSGISSGTEIDNISESDSLSSGDADNEENLLLVKTVYFEYDESRVSEDARRVIRAHAVVLSRRPDIGVYIEGHADERGTHEYNLALGDQRGEAVSRHFQEYGIDKSRITVVSFGEEIPRALGSDEDFWSLNRRAEIIYDE